MTDRPVAAVVLAAGQGKRMRSQTPKVLHHVCGEPMIDHVLRALETAGIGPLYLIIGHLGEQVSAHVGDRAVCIEQTERLGTGHAVMQAAPQLANFDGDLVIACGDTPLLTARTLADLVARRREQSCAGVVLTAVVDNPKGYGRIVRRDRGTVQRIIEEKDCTEAQRKIQEVNIGTYCFDARKLFGALGQIGNNNAQGEYYLTDVVEILMRHGQEIDALTTADWTEMIGINAREQLAEAHGYLRARLVRQWMDAGVTILDPATTTIEARAIIGNDAVLEPGTIIRGASVLGEACHIGPGAELIDAHVGDGARVWHSVVEGADIAAGATVGPFAHVKF